MDFRNPGSFNGANRDQPCRYDDLGRLEKATGSDLSGAWQRRFVYDRWGNRTQVWNATVGGTQTQQVNLALIGSAPSNRVASYWDTAATGGATKTVSYDAAGNTTNDGTYSFTYDAENRIVQVNGVATGALVATYTYDSANRRIKKTVGTTTTCYIWEGAQVIAEYNNAASPVSPNTEYIFTGGRMLAEERAGTGTTRFFHQDRLSTRLTTNSAGAVLGTQSHLPFGEQLTESSEQQKWKFTTYERDSETGDDYAINRGYWPTLGRFRQADPIAGALSNPQSLNRNFYVGAEYNNAASPVSPNTEYIFTGGRMLAEERAGTGTTRFFHQDRLSTRLTTNSAGAVLGTQSHLPFGEQLTESSEQQKWKFTTYERDSETGDDYAINRGYWPTLGRFRQGDAILSTGPNPQLLNRFAYVKSDPVNLIDPFGLDCVPLPDGTFDCTSDPPIVRLEGTGHNSSFSGFGSSPCTEIYIDGFYAGSTCGGPQNTYDLRVDFRDHAENLLKDKSKSDCLKLALLVYKAGQVAGGDASGTVSTLLNGLTEFSSISRTGTTPSDRNFRVGVFRNDPHFGGGFRASGFRREFVDPSNQVRHFVGFFAAGYQTDRFSARAGLAANEGTLSSSNHDVALGLAAINLGVQFNGNYRQLAQDIWHNICGQTSNLNLP